jgi:hypothetical protein
MPISNNILAGSGQVAADLGETIEQSLRFSGDGRLVASTSATTGNFTISFWWKRAIGVTNTHTFFMFTPNQAYQYNEGTDEKFASRVTSFDFLSDGKLRDHSAWYHVVLVNNSGTTTMYLNGVRQTDTATTPSGSGDMCIGSNQTASQDDRLVGYLAEYNMLDGTVVGHTTIDGQDIIDEFGRYNEDGVWVPKEITFTAAQYGAKGFRLTFDSSQTNANIGEDSAPIGASGHTARNDFTASGFDTAAISSTNEDNDVDYNDTPTNNYATLNPLNVFDANVTYSKANLRANYGTVNNSVVFVDMPMADGKYYWELTLKDQVEGWAGVITEDYVKRQLSAFADNSDSWAYALSGSTNNQKRHIGNNTDSHGSLVADDTIGFLLDTASGTLEIEINGTTQSNSEFTNIPTNKRLFVAFNIGGGSGNVNMDWNFGQMPFVHSQTGYSDVATNSLPVPVVKEGNKHFGVLTYTTPGSPSFPITIDGSGGNNGDGTVDFDQAPDMVWFKMTNGATEGVIFDSLRGAGEYVQPRNNAIATSVSNFAFANNGFTFSSQQEQYYRQNDAYVAYCWKAGGAPTATNTQNAGTQQTAGSVMVDGQACDGTTGGFTDGTIQVKKMSVNTTAGFSIVQYEGTGSNGSIPHGLGTDVIPKWVITKRFDGPGNWENYHVSIGNTATILFDSTNGQTADSATHWNNTTPTDAVVTLGGGGANNSLNEDMIAYIFAEVPGYSKFGKYVGAGSGSNPDYDGPFEYLGFKPAWLMVKRTNVNGDEWTIWNSQSDPNNFAFRAHRIGAITPETSGDTFAVDLLANGFKIRSSAATINSTGSDYIYCAFAEHPFGGKNQPPATAR